MLTWFLTLVTLLLSLQSNAEGSDREEFIDDKEFVDFDGMSFDGTASISSGR